MQDTVPGAPGDTIRLALYQTMLRHEKVSCPLSYVSEGLGSDSRAHTLADPALYILPITRDTGYIQNVMWAFCVTGVCVCVCGSVSVYGA